jgi:hypothetical protein
MHAFSLLIGHNILDLKIGINLVVLFIIRAP